MEIVALHGFLGTPKDWDFLSYQTLFAIDILQISLPKPQNGFWDWAHQFNQWMTPKKERRILMGYSLGGRLAMHALLANPELWDAGVIISAHPGLSEEEDKIKRLKVDQQRAWRFEKEPWNSLMSEWDTQAIFQGSQKLVRKEGAYQREQLSLMLQHWSLGKQENLKAKLENFEKPILWVAGQRDSSYSVLYQAIKSKHPLSNCWIVPNGTHRVPWDEPKDFEERLISFARSLYEH